MDSSSPLPVQEYLKYCLCRYCIIFKYSTVEILSPYNNKGNTAGRIRVKSFEFFPPLPCDQIENNFRLDVASIRQLHER